jgi:hypothetical protein
MKISGGCHCSSITVKRTLIRTVAICPPQSNAFGISLRVVVPAKREGFKLLTGEPRIYVKTGESGRQRVQSFCHDCGTPIYSAAVTDPQMFSIRVGTVHQRAELPPKVQLWCRSALGWVIHPEPTTLIATQDF